jgi:hypothetical protein
LPQCLGLDSGFAVARRPGMTVGSHMKKPIAGGA